MLCLALWQIAVIFHSGMMLRPIQHLRARRCIETKDLIRVSVLWCSLSALWDQVWDTSVGKLGVEAVDTVLVVQTYSVEMPQDRKLGCSTSLPDCTFLPFDLWWLFQQWRFGWWFLTSIHTGKDIQSGYSSGQSLWKSAFSGVHLVTQCWTSSAGQCIT